MAVRWRWSGGSGEGFCRVGSRCEASCGGRQPVPAAEPRTPWRGGGKAASLASVGVGGVSCPGHCLTEGKRCTWAQPPWNGHSAQVVFPVGCLSHVRGKAKCNLHSKLTGFPWHVLPADFCQRRDPYRGIPRDVCWGQPRRRGSPPLQSPAWRLGGRPGCQRGEPHAAVAQSSAVSGGPCPPPSPWRSPKLFLVLMCVFSMSVFEGDVV